MKSFINENKSLSNDPKVLMIFSYDFMGPFTRDLARGFTEKSKTFALISLSIRGGIHITTSDLVLMDAARRR